MAKVNDLLSKRFKKNSQKLSKMTGLAEMSSSGKLSSFSGVFRFTPLSDNEEQNLRELLKIHVVGDIDISNDLKFLSAITSEVKAINNQAAILHGERIKQAQNVLKKYKDGAFSSWLLLTYGNRQTPYNFLQYFEFYSQMPKSLQQKIDSMPRQAVYALAARNCNQDEKIKIVESYKGETKKELLEIIRERFPLSDKDKRASKPTEQVLSTLKLLEKQIEQSRFKPTSKQLEVIRKFLKSLLKKI